MVRHDHPHLRPTPYQFANQFGGLVSGDAAGDAQNDSSFLQHGGSLSYGSIADDDPKDLITGEYGKIKEFMAVENN